MSLVHLVAWLLMSWPDSLGSYSKAALDQPCFDSGGRPWSIVKLQFLIATAMSEITKEDCAYQDGVDLKLRVGCMLGKMVKMDVVAGELLWATNVLICVS